MLLYQSMCFISLVAAFLIYGLFILLVCIDYNYSIYLAIIARHLEYMVTVRKGKTNSFPE